MNKRIYTNKTEIWLKWKTLDLELVLLLTGYICAYYSLSKLLIISYCHCNKWIVTYLEA